MKKVLLIIPAYNEEGSIEKTVRTIEAYRSTTVLPFELDYVVINDGSKDNTGLILDKHGFNHIDLVQNLGIGGGVQTGYIYAQRQDYDVAVQFDGDGQHDIRSIQNVVQPILANQADFVIGSRFVNKTLENFQSTVMRRVGINLISNAIKLTTGKRVYDTTSGYRAANKTVIAYFADHYPVQYPEPESTTRLLKKGFRLKEVPANMFEREAGVSSISSLKAIFYMTDVLTSIIIAGFLKEDA
ncbi:glycosyltransferase family 2 protein [Streptococcus halichoeri]|uniref:glycosyltransferase family 2 protein n=1 Tax=Streptococcus halichoeri TaxID=254785 RepID=UPI000DB54547|nr:glycosyltransferase family 2 protein [Streptococcus halichoeri]PZO94882.1 MAG: glycosyl transferase family 2 [Streptococcus pyogenes]